MGLSDWLSIGLSLLAAMFLVELTAWAPRISDRLLTLATRLLPEHHRARTAEEWRRLLEDVPGPLSRIAVAGELLFRAAQHPGSALQVCLVSATDRVNAFCTLIFIAPLILIILILTSLAGARDILVSVETRGRFGKTFDRQYIAIASPDDLRASRGYFWFLCKIGFHELPILSNIVRGEMSILGPLPLDASQKYECSDESIRPGIVSPSDLFGIRSRNPSEQRCHDVAIMKNITLDTYILAMIMIIPAFFTTNRCD
ncbi:sugar transferase [Phenylobacterium sp.]|jgi:lipopolysaccharide/colanic/teichoic acid biosynthesis glycosyltransferase|uniref:sugar transferase n=1 Tax=Phenylobacterium sp. TaxID=1871053 RepID=UPI000C97771C|nr:hypothetical protein [Phenylobacterium sp.]